MTQEIFVADSSKDKESVEVVLDVENNNADVTDASKKKPQHKTLLRSFVLGGKCSELTGAEVVDLDNVVPAEKQITGVGGEYVKSFVFGGLDGIVSTFALVAGLGGANVDIRTLIAVGIAKVLSDAFSMGFGEYTSAKAEGEQSEQLRSVQQKALSQHPDGEAKEMIHIYLEKGLEQEDALTIASLLMKYEEIFLEHILAFKFGTFGGDDDDKWQALKQGAVCFLAFAMFGSVPLIGFIIFFAIDRGQTQDIRIILAIAYGLTAFTLVVMGFCKAKLAGTGGACRSGALMLINGTVAGGLAYLVGEVLTSAIH